MAESGGAEQVKASSSSSSPSSPDMDAGLWGALQSHVALENIYTKLPFREFFQLRLVCKHWNRLASDRAFLEKTYAHCLLPSPFFVLDAQGPDDKVRGLLARDGRSNLWTWTRLPYSHEFCSVAGLVLFNEVETTTSEERRRVFNLHTRVLLTLPPRVEQTSQLCWFSGMDVDTSLRPYAFRIFQGNDDVCTQIFDSTLGSWETRASRQFGMSPGIQAVAAFAKGVLYIRCELDMIVVYETERDAWHGINPPPSGDCDDYLRGIGAWEGRVFHPSVDPRERVIRVWELRSLAEEEWVEVDRMPGELHRWLLYDDGDAPSDPSSSDLQIVASYCEELILLYSWWVHVDEGDVARGERFVTCNLQTRQWQKLELPFAPINEHLPSQGQLFAFS